LTGAVASHAPVEIEQIVIGADPATWARAGFAVEGEATRVGSVGIRFASGTGVIGWRLSGDAGEIDGLPLAARAEPPVATEPHPNGAVRIDHVVVFTPDLERTTGAFEERGVERRRVREVETDHGALRQGFFRLGEVILEAVEHARIADGPARFWGITFAVADLDACAELLGEHLSPVRDAVQPGRRIATVRREAELGLPVALITAESRDRSSGSVPT
jgi:hypothetical protein